MATKPSYRVSVYTHRGTYLAFDQEFQAATKAQRAKALSCFIWACARNIDDETACVLLSQGETTLASKSTGDFHVVYNRAYYVRNWDINASVRRGA